MLYFVATPIGNLREITLRAIDVLKSCDAIYAEDTRHSLVLLREYGIDKKPLISYQKFNERARTLEIVERLKDGQSVALISDAGMPLISDPGNILVEVLIENGLEYTVISGACACVNALILSGFNTSAFCMLGFLPTKNSARQRLLNDFKNTPCTLIFYSAPHDVRKDLASLYEAFKARRVAVVREMTKMFETVHRGTLGEEIDIVEKGEMVIVVEGAKKAEEFDGDISIKEQVLRLMKEGIEKNEAIKCVAKSRNLPKNDVYKEFFE